MEEYDKGIKIVKCRACKTEFAAFLLSNEEACPINSCCGICDEINK